jgi:hypothetical protein
MKRNSSLREDDDHHRFDICGNVERTIVR